MNDVISVFSCVFRRTMNFRQLNPKIEKISLLVEHRERRARGSKREKVAPESQLNIRSTKPLHQNLITPYYCIILHHTFKRGSLQHHSRSAANFHIKIQAARLIFRRCQWFTLDENFFFKLQNSV